MTNTKDRSSEQDDVGPVSSEDEADAALVPRPADADAGAGVDAASDGAADGRSTNRTGLTPDSIPVD